MDAVAIVVAAGKGIRFGGNTPKSLVTLGGKPLMVHCLQTLNQSRWIDNIILVTSRELVSTCEKEILHKYSLVRVDQVIEGGKERQDSVMAGLKAISHPPQFVLIQDAARPFLTEDMIEQTLHGAKEVGGAVIATKITDTVKETDGSAFVQKTIPRDNLWSVQTPQTFNYSILVSAYQWAFDNHLQVTDDASLVEKFGNAVKLIPGTKNNIKITTPEDLELAELLLKKR